MRKVILSSKITSQPVETKLIFFTDDLINLWSPSASTSTITPPSLDSLSLEEEIPIPIPAIDITSPYQFELLHLGIDRRLLLNRKLKLKMYRIWLQGTWRKPLTSINDA